MTWAYVHQAAGRHADIDTLLQATELGLVLDDSVIQGAVMAGCFEKLDWLLTVQQLPLPENIGYFAASHSSVATVQWLRTKGVALPDSAMDTAAARGYVALLDYLHKEAGFA